MSRDVERRQGLLYLGDQKKRVVTKERKLEFRLRRQDKQTTGPSTSSGEKVSPTFHSCIIGIWNIRLAGTSSQEKALHREDRIKTRHIWGIQIELPKTENIGAGDLGTWPSSRIIVAGGSLVEVIEQNYEDRRRRHHRHCQRQRRRRR